MVHPDDREKVNKAYTESLKDKRPYDVTHRLKLSNGEVKYVQERCFTEYSGSDEPVRSFGTVQDITEQVLSLKESKAMEQQLYQSSKLATIGELAAGIAHEINNPLTVLSMSVDKLARECSESSYQSYFEKQRVAIKRIANIVNNLRIFSHQNEDKPEVFSLSHAINDAVSFVKELYETKGIAFKIKLSNTDLKILGHSSEFQQILMNLFSNAKDAMSGQTNRAQIIKVELTQVREKAIVKVHDNGTGIPEEIRDKVFDRFYTSKKTGLGTGLGLSIIKGLTESVNGQIDFETKKD